MYRFAFLAFACLLSAAHADYLIYYYTANAPIPLEGKVNKLISTYQFTHPRYGTMSFRKSACEHFPTPDYKEVMNRKVADAIKKSDWTELMKIGEDGLRKGYPSALIKASEMVIESEPDNKVAKLVKAVMDEIEKPIDESEEEEKQIREHCSNHQKMKVTRSKHFILLNDLSEEPDKSSKSIKISRVQEKVNLIEKVYTSFILFFASRGVKIDVPKERMRVVIFKERDDFEVAATQGRENMDDATLQILDGFWDPIRNTSFFYEHSTNDDLKKVQNAVGVIEKMAEDARRKNMQGRAELVQDAKALKMVVNMYQESADVEVLSHEITHQMAGNTGLLPRDRFIPRWVHEGLATYFESPRDTSWGGIGCINSSHLRLYRAMSRGKLPPNMIDIITSDQVFTKADSPEMKIGAYALSWGLTHFFMERHFDKLMKYYKSLAAQPPSKIRRDDKAKKLFDSVFGQANSMHVPWGNYMSNLKTDWELVVKKDED